MIMDRVCLFYQNVFMNIFLIFLIWEICLIYNYLMNSILNLFYFLSEFH